MMKEPHLKILAGITMVVSLLILALILSDKQGEIAIQKGDTAVTALPHTKHPARQLSIPGKTAKIPSVAEVQKNVDELNRDNVKRLEAFEDDGWETVTIDDPPDEKLMNLDLSLLDEREEELQFQIQSNSYPDDDLDPLIGVAVATGNEKTRYVALEALGRAGGKRAGELLMEAYEQFDDPDTRSQILGYLLPTSPTDDVAVFLAGRLGEDDVPESVKRQASYPLAIMALLDGEGRGAVSEEISALVPDSWRTEFEGVIEALRIGGRTRTGQ